MFFDRLRALRRDVRALHRAQLAAVGPETAARLEAHGVLVDVVPEEFRAEGVAAAMRAGRRRRQARAAAARRGGARDPAAVGCARPAPSSTRWRATATRAAAQRPGELRALLAARRGRPGHLHQLEHGAQLRRPARRPTRPRCCAGTAIGCIGPITADTARAAGLHGGRSAGDVHDSGVRRRASWRYLCRHRERLRRERRHASKRLTRSGCLAGVQSDRTRMRLWSPHRAS